MYSLLLLKTKTQFYILCTVSGYTLAYTLQSFLYGQKTIFQSFLQEHHQNLLCCFVTFPKIQALSLTIKKPNTTVQKAKTNRKNFLNG